MTKIAIPIASMSLIAGCSSHEAGPEASPWSVDIPAVTAAPAPDDLCSDPNLVLPGFQSSQVVDEDYETILKSGRRNSYEPLTLAESLKLMADLETEYGLKVTFPDVPPATATYDFGAIANDPETKTEAVSANLSGLVEAVRLFSPDLIRALKLTEIAYVKNITLKPGYEGVHSTIDKAGGLYDSLANRIYVDMTTIGESSSLFLNTKETVVHEIIHAIDDQLLCGNKDFNLDTAITRNNTMGYLGYSNVEHDLEEKYTTPSAVREYATQYGASSIAEDRATILEWTLTDRGLILPGDPDADSPLAKKQAELVRRLNELNPGFIDFLKIQTMILRDGAIHRYTYDGYTGQDNELDMYITSEHFPGEQKPGTVILKDAIDAGLELEIVKNGYLEIQRVGFAPKQTIQNPILLRDPVGKITGVAWSSNSSFSGPNTDKEFYAEAHFFDESRMTLIYNGATPEIVSGPVQAITEPVPYGKGAIEDEKYKFYTTRLELSGIVAKEIYEDKPENTGK